MSKELKFNVTLKGNIKKNIFVSWNLLLPQLILFIATIFGFGINLNRIINTNSVGFKESLIINIAWASYNLIGMVIIITNKPIEPAKTEVAINHSINKHYADLSMEDILRDILKLDNEKITIIGMYEELIEMKKKLIDISPKNMAD